MRHLMLLRHAKTETDAPSGRDQDRRLDERGHRDAAEIGTWIGSHPPFPDHVMVSPAVRAVQTWDIAWEALQEHAPKPQIELAGSDFDVVIGQDEPPPIVGEFRHETIDQPQ